MSIGAPSSNKLPYVDLNNEAVMALMCDHILGQGARNVPLVIGNAQRQLFEDYESVYRAHLEALGMRPRIIRLDETTAQDAARDWVMSELAENPDLDAVIAPIDAMANGIVSGLRASGRTIPSDVMVLTRYNGIRAQTETPPLTAVDLHLEQAAELATNMLLDLIDDQASPHILQVQRPELVVRSSTMSEAFGR